MGTAAAVTLVSWLAALVAGTAQQPATRPDSGSPEARLVQSTEACRRAFTAVEESVRLMDRVEIGETARDQAQALKAARTRLAEARAEMSRCMLILEQLQQGTFGPTRTLVPATLRDAWACPMHPQVRQDRPGNCPICDATLRASTGVSTSRPAKWVHSLGAEQGKPDETLGQSSAGR